MSMSSHLEMKYPPETNMALNHAAAGFLFFVTRYFVPICLSVITAVSLLELVFFMMVATASSILLLRNMVYALYNRNKCILGYLSSVILIQFAVAILISAFSVGLLPMPPIDLPVFQALAPLIREQTYDVSILALIIAKRWKNKSLNELRDRGGILRIIVKDGIMYFLTFSVIFSTMFIWLCVDLFAPYVNAYLVSIMINRLTIHLHLSVKASLPTWMISTRDYSSSRDIDEAAIRDLGDLTLSHESQGIELKKRDCV
ncbi:hypothetical protein JB92DRAFT_3058759 [Gautieria morchelliformis]|nr:hypothetical protein JB92DRAFT_3058759 [Gautieria morchelliformis]